MVTTKMDWNNNSYWNNPSLLSAKLAWISVATTAGKTDGTHQIINDVSITRTWTDQAAADEWTTFITNLATQYGYTVTVTNV